MVATQPTGSPEESEVLGLAGSDEALSKALAELVRHANGDPVILLEIASLVRASKNTQGGPGCFATSGLEEACDRFTNTGSCSCWVATQPTGYTHKSDNGTTCHSWNNNGTSGGPVCIVESATEHEDWPSLVDAALGMMESDAEMAAEAEDSAPEDGGSNATPMALYQGNEETDQTGGGGAETVELLDLAGDDAKLRTAVDELVKHANGNKAILRELVVLITAWKATPHNYGKGGYCGTWLTNFCARVPKKFQGAVGAMDNGDSILKVTPVWFPQGNPSIGSGYAMILKIVPGHFAARIRFPDGFIVYFDNGWAGNEAGNEGMFTFSAATGIPIPLKVIYSPIPTSFPEPGWPK